MARGPRKNTFGGNPDHVTLGLVFGYRVRVAVDVPRHTREACATLRRRPRRTRNTGPNVLPGGVCSMVIKRECRALAEVGALLWALLLTYLLTSNVVIFFALTTVGLHKLQRRANAAVYS